MSCAVVPLFSHPALLPPTPPLTPLLHVKPTPPLARKAVMTPPSPLSPSAKNNIKAATVKRPSPAIGTQPASASALRAGIVPPPIHSYAMLRAYHATALKYMIAKLRWEQSHNGYIVGADAWEKHINVINILEDELTAVEAAQKGLDRFPNCHYPVADPKPHGPPTLEDVVEKETKERARDKLIDRELGKQFPFFKQLFIGPMTKYQARAHVELREILMSGEIYPEDLEELLPTENFKMAMGEIAPRPAPPPAVPVGAGRRGSVPLKQRKMTYDEVRLERENAKIAQQLKDKGIELNIGDKEKEKEKKEKIGPLTREEYFASLPKYGPKTKAQAMLPVQREQRQMILAWLRQPWPEWDEEAAELIHKLGNMAFARLEERSKATKVKTGEKEMDKEKKTERVQETEKRRAIGAGTGNERTEIQVKDIERGDTVVKREKERNSLAKKEAEGDGTVARPIALSKDAEWRNDKVPTQNAETEGKANGPKEITIKLTVIKASKADEEDGEDGELDSVGDEENTVVDVIEIRL